MSIARESPAVNANSTGSPRGDNRLSRPEWLNAILYSGQVTRVGQHLALVLFHVSDEGGVAALSMRDLERITGWGRTAICEHLREIADFIHVTFGRGRAKSTFELQGVIPSVRQTDTTADTNQGEAPSVRAPDTMADAKTDTTAIVRPEDAKTDTNPSCVRQPDAKSSLGGTIGGETKNYRRFKNLSSGEPPKIWTWSEVTGFEGRAFDLNIEYCRQLERAYPALEWPGELVAADGFLARQFDKSAVPVSESERLSRLETYLAKKNRDVGALRSAHDEAARQKAGQVDDSCYFRGHELVIANGFREGLLAKVGGDEAKLDETIMKAAGKIPMKLRGDELKKLVISEFMKFVDWDKIDRERGKAKVKEAAGSRWARKLTARSESKTS